MADDVFHATFTRNLPDIQKRGLDPLSESLWLKQGTGERYQPEPSIYSFSDPGDALRWASKMRYEFGYEDESSSPADVSIVRLRGGEHWHQDPSEDVNLGGSSRRSLQSIAPQDVLEVISVPEPAGINEEFQRAVPGGGFDEWIQYYGNRIKEPRPPDQSNLPFIEGPPVEIGDALQPSLVTSEGGPPRFLYRIISQQEYDAAQEKGSLSPSSSYGRHHASASPESQYLEPENNVLLRITYSPEDEWYSKWGGNKVYGVSSKDIPFSRAEKITSGSSRDIGDFLKKFNEPRPPDQSNLPAVIDAAAAASRLALPPDDEPRPKGKAFGSGIGSLMRRRMFPLIQAVQQGYEHLLTEEQKNDLREFLAQPTHEFFGFEESGLESLKEKLGISHDDMPGETSLSVIEGRKEKPLDEVSQSTLKRRLKAAKNELSDLTGMTVKRDVTNRMEKRIEDLGKEDPLLAKRLDSLVDRIYDLKERINPDTRFGPTWRTHPEQGPPPGDWETRWEDAGGSEVLFGAPPIPPWLKKKNEGTLYEALNSLPKHVRGYTGEILPDEYSIAKALSRLSPDAIRAADRFLKLRDGKGLLDHTFPQTQTDTIIKVDPDLPRTDQETVQNRIRNILDPESQSYIRLVDEEPPDTGMAHGGLVQGPLSVIPDMLEYGMRRTPSERLMNVPRNPVLGGQQHMLAYITPEEASTLREQGGGVTPTGGQYRGPGGIASFFGISGGQGAAAAAAAAAGQAPGGAGHGQGLSPGQVPGIAGTDGNVGGYGHDGRTKGPVGHTGLGTANPTPVSLGNVQSYADTNPNPKRAESYAKTAIDAKKSEDALAKFKVNELYNKRFRVHPRSMEFDVLTGQINDATAAAEGEGYSSGDISKRNALKAALTQDPKGFYGEHLGWVDPQGKVISLDDFAALSPEDASHVTANYSTKLDPKSPFAGLLTGVKSVLGFVDPSGVISLVSNIGDTVNTLSGKEVGSSFYGVPTSPTGLIGDIFSPLADDTPIPPTTSIFARGGFVDKPLYSRS